MYINPEVLFERYKDTLTKFGEKHNLLIEKYRHDGPAWFFYYRRTDKKGYCMIEVIAYEDGRLAIFAYWGFSNRKELKEYLAKIWIPDLHINDQELEVLIEKVFNELNLKTEKDINDVKDLAYVSKTWDTAQHDINFDGANYPICKL